MKLAIIITGLSVGGAETMLHKLLQRIDRSRFEISVVSLTTKGVIGSRIEALGIPVFSLGMKPAFPNPLRFLRLIRQLRELRPDVVHTWMYHADLLGGLAARLAGIRRVVWGLRHSNLSPDKNKRSTLWVVMACAKCSAWLPRAILSCSERAREIHTAAGYCARRMTVIPNGFDLAQFAPDVKSRDSVRAELGLTADVTLVGLIARDHPQKNHPGFVEAAARVNRAVPDAHFLLVGTGIDEQNRDLIQAISKSGVRDNCHLLGRRDDIPRLMAALDVLASSSWGEAFPNVLGEAMACGVPCVVTDVGDSAEIVGNAGRVVPTGDMEGLAYNMVELLTQPEERAVLGLRARKRVRERYEIGDVVRRYENFYLQLLEKA